MALEHLLHPRVCELGKIKIGGLGETRTSKNGKVFRLPRKDDHFTITTLVRNVSGDLIKDTDLMHELLQDYGDPDGKLRQLPIVLLSDNIEEVMQCSWVWYGGGKCWARSDGQTVTWFGDPKTMSHIDQPFEEPWRPEFADLKNPRGDLLFKLHTVFNCVIASKESRWGGVYKLRTTSRITGEQLYGSMLHIGNLTGGYLQGLPMRLVVRPIQVAPDGKPTTVYVVHCELRGPDLLSVQKEALKLVSCRMENVKQLAEYRKLLAAPGHEIDEVEIAEIQQEFHPEVSQREPIVMPRAIGDATPEPAPEQHEEPTSEPLGRRRYGNQRGEKRQGHRQVPGRDR